MDQAKVEVTSNNWEDRRKNDHTNKQHLTLLTKECVCEVVLGVDGGGKESAVCAGVCAVTG